MWFENVDWIHLVQDIDQWRIVVNTEKLSHYPYCGTRLLTQVIYFM
jgi:hypothetical protein